MNKFMLRFFSIFILILFSYLSSAQDAYHQALSNQLSEEFNITGGTQLLNDSEDANISATGSYGNISNTTSDDAENPFSKYFSIEVNSEGTNPWDAGINIRNTKSIDRNDNALVVFWLRGNSDESLAQVNFFVEKSETFEKEILITVEATEEWSQYMIPFSAQRTYAANTLVSGLHLAFAKQHIDYAGLAIINYEDKYTLQDLPTKLGSGPYAGFEDDAPWRAAAAERIDKYRKADLTLKLTQVGGVGPVKNKEVRVRMKKHEFEFGTAVVASRFANNRDQLQIYEDKLTNLDGQGNGFNSVVFENALKWKAWEGEWPTNKSEKIKAIEWLKEKDITIRGHNLVWPGWNFLPDDMESNKNNPSFLVNNIKERIDNILNYDGIKGNIKDWDVINEIAANRDIEDALKGTTGYTTGREIYAEMFKQVKEIDPEITTYLNDYITIGQNRDSGVLYDEFKKYIREIIDAGGQIDGIGFQAHIGGSPTAPEKVYRILDDFHQEFQTEAKITEYDTDRLVSGELGAKYMDDFLTIIFSHHSVKGFLMWGFWDGNHWKQNAPIYNLDWTLKPSGEAFINKVYNEWWTDETLRTNDEGEVTLRGFKGEYEITSSLMEEPVLIQLTGDTSIILDTGAIISTSEVDFENEFSLYPNPAQDIITISNNDKEDFAVSIFDINGRKLHEKYGTNKYEIDISSQVPGIYFIKVRMGKTSFTKKIVKQ